MFKPFSWISRRGYRRWFYPLISLLVALGLVVGSPHATSAFSWTDLIGPGIQVIQLTSMSDKQEVALGKEMNDQLLQSEFRLYGDRDLNEYVTEIGERLVPASDRPNIPYTFQVVSDDSINAFATMGGFVYVTTGLLKAVDNEAQLAGVIGHEIGHITSKHVLKQMRQTIIARGLADAAGLDRNVAVQIGMEVTLRLPGSRKAEYEADRKGLDTMSRAGYAQAGMIGFFEKLLNQRSIPNFLSTHPATGDRIAALEKSIDPARANIGDGLNSADYKARIQPLLG